MRTYIHTCVEYIVYHSHASPIRLLFSVIISVAIYFYLCMYVCIYVLHQKNSLHFEPLYPARPQHLRIKTMEIVKLLSTCFSFFFFFFFGR